MFFQLKSIIFFFICVDQILSLKPKLTLDEFFNYTYFSSLTLSPNDGQSILIQTLHPIWEKHINEEHLYLQTLRGENRKLITRQASSFKPQWKDQFIALILDNTSDQFQGIYLYSISMDQLNTILKSKEEIHAFTWSTTSMTLYYATRSPWLEEIQLAYEEEWHDTIEYREQHRGDTIYQVDISPNMTISNIQILTNISLRVNELISSLDGNQLIFSTQPPSLNQEQIIDYELFSLELNQSPPLIPIRLTNNSAVETNLKYSANGLLYFTVTAKGSIEGDYEDSQGQLYSFNTTSHRIDRWARHFKGEITDYALLQDGKQGVVVLGQLGIEIQVYTQQSVNTDLIKQVGWNGSYQSITTSSHGNSSTIIFIHSSFETPQEVYFAQSIDQLTIAQPITSENELFTQRNLPKGKSYRWINEDDQTQIEGVLLYPPEQFEQKNLPLLVLIHGGPYDADLNIFRADWYYCGAIMATEGWLVLQPNYRGSTGYGDEFLRGVRFEILSRPGKDILYGVDALIRDGIADPTKLTVGGYSYGGYLTNWLITQTTRFNAALSGAAAPEHVADWGLTDIPLTSVYMFGGYPWEVPSLYEKEAPIYQLHKVRTPTHIVVPGADTRVPWTENYILERGLHALGIATKMIVFPGEEHGLANDPWHGKIKIREELKWLKQYGYSHYTPTNETSNSASLNRKTCTYLLVYALLILFTHYHNYGITVEYNTNLF